MSTFSFSFSGDDIEDTATPLKEAQTQYLPNNQAAETGFLTRLPPSSTPASKSATASAFPLPNQTQLPPQSHALKLMLHALPSKICYSTLTVKLDDGSEICIPRRELWDVRVQLMAEDDDEGLGNLGKDDVKTGVYEGGFKSWESSVDLVRVLYGRCKGGVEGSWKVVELGCGTALPSLAVFQWLLQSGSSGRMELGLADYNPTVLQLVTLPNLLLSWAQVTRRESWEAEGELEIDDKVIQAFLASLQSHQVKLSFFSGAWSAEFVELVGREMGTSIARTTVIGAETIYSPAALKSFAETLLGLLDKLPDHEKSALVAAKKVYFGVGGSMEDFCDMVRAKGRNVEQIREESDGVRRVTVEVRT